MDTDADAVLRRLRLAGFAGVDGLARSLGATAGSTEAALDVLAGRGWARFADGRAAGVASGWSLTSAGRAEADRLLAADVESRRCRPAVESGYRRFLDLNRTLLEVIIDWQVRGGAVNDHADHRYDERVLARLERINEKISPVLADLAACAERYGSYRHRLDAAVARARAGEVDYVDRAVVDSYHTVWFELHEDLLATLGLDRAQEAAASTDTSEVP
jgi:hypothetical protein